MAVEDCQKAIQIDPSSIKAHFFMGQALSQLESYDDAIAALKRGEDICHILVCACLCMNVFGSITRTACIHYMHEKLNLAHCSQDEQQ